MSITEYSREREKISELAQGTNTNVLKTHGGFPTINSILNGNSNFQYHTVKRI